MPSELNTQQFLEWAESNPAVSDFTPVLCDLNGGLVATVRGYLLISWQSRPAALLPVSMYDADGSPFAGDPRNALGRIIELYHAQGLTPVCAAEMEFYLYEPKKSGEKIAPPVLPHGTRRLSENAYVSDREALPSTCHEAVSLFASSAQMRGLFGDYLVDVFTTCKRQEMAAFAAIMPQSEYDAYLEVV